MTHPMPDTAAPPPARTAVAERPLRGLEVVLSQVGDSMGPDLIVAELHGPLTHALLVEACFRVQQRHPGLRAAIQWPQGRGQRPWLRAFAPDRQALDVQVVPPPADDPAAGPAPWRASHAAHWQWVAQQQSAHRFDLDRGFLLRVVWVPAAAPAGRAEATPEGGHLIVCSHHAVVDGTSLMRLLDQIVRQLAALRAQLEAGAADAAAAAARLAPVQPLPLSAAIHSHLRFGLLERLAVRIGRWQAVREQRAFTQRPWLPMAAPRPAPAPPGVATLCVFAEGQADRWQALQPLCKQHGVTVGGAFAAAVQLATARLLVARGLPLPGGRGQVAMPLSMDYNMRGRLDHGQVDDQAIGLGTSIAGVGVKVAPDIRFWPLARRLMDNARLQHRLRVPKLFQGVTDAVLDYTGFWAAHGVDHRASGGAGDGINISNVGRYPFATTQGPYRIERIFGFNGACVGGPMFIFWLRQINGRLCYNAIGCSPAVDRPMLEAVFGHLVDLMEQRVPSAESADLTLAGYARQDTAAAAPSAGTPAWAH